MFGKSGNDKKLSIWDQLRQNIQMVGFVTPPQYKELINEEELTKVVDATERLVEGSLDVLDDKFSKWSMARRARRGTPDDKVAAGESPAYTVPVAEPAAPVSPLDAALDLYTELKSKGVTNPTEIIKAIQARYPDLDLASFARSMMKTTKPINTDKDTPNTNG